VYWTRGWGRQCGLPRDPSDIQVEIFRCWRTKKEMAATHPGCGPLLCHALRCLIQASAWRRLSGELGKPMKWVFPGISSSTANEEDARVLATTR
jgi:hypothetical protein